MYAVFGNANFQFKFYFTKFHTKIQTFESLKYMLIIILQNWATFNVRLFIYVIKILWNKLYGSITL